MNADTPRTARWIILLSGWLTAVPLARAAEPEKLDIVIPDSPEDIKIRYAEVNLELAEVELQKMLEANKKASGLYSKEVLDREKAEISVAQELCRVAKNSRGNEDATEVYLVRAREDAKLAKREYLRALETKDRDLVYTDLQLKELRLNAELSQLRLAMWMDPQQTISLMQHMHWQVARLSEEVLDLRKKVADLERKLNRP